MKFKTLVLATVIGAIAVSGCGILNGKKQSTHVHTIDCTIANIKDAHPDFKLEEKVPVIQSSLYLHSSTSLYSLNDMEESKHINSEQGDISDRDDYIVIVSGLGTKSFVYRTGNKQSAPIYDYEYTPSSTIQNSSFDYGSTKVLGIELESRSTKKAFPIIGTYKQSGKENIVIGSKETMHDLTENASSAYIQSGTELYDFLTDNTLLSFEVNNFGNKQIFGPEEWSKFNQFRTVNLKSLDFALYKSEHVYISDPWKISETIERAPLGKLIHNMDYEVNYFIQPQDVKEINILKYIKRDKKQLTFSLITINKEGKSEKTVTVDNRDNQQFSCNGITFSLKYRDQGLVDGFFHGARVSLITTADYKYNSQIHTSDYMLLDAKKLLKYYGVTL